MERVAPLGRLPRTDLLGFPATLLVGNYYLSTPEAVSCMVQPWLLPPDGDVGRVADGAAYAQPLAPFDGRSAIAEANIQGSPAWSADGTRVVLYAVIDNFSRTVLGCAVDVSLDPLVTCKVLYESFTIAGSYPATVIADTGGENYNYTVSEFFSRISTKLEFDQNTIAESNSMIEAFWKLLRHNFLYLHNLDAMATVRRLVSFYVEQHNTVMPHHALNGRTPQEVFFGENEDLPERLAEAHRDAIRIRLSEKGGDAGNLRLPGLRDP
jgi:hypothetical protein